MRSRIPTVHLAEFTSARGRMFEWRQGVTTSHPYLVQPVPMCQGRTRRIKEVDYGIWLVSFIGYDLDTSICNRKPCTSYTPSARAVT